MSSAAATPILDASQKAKDRPKTHACHVPNSYFELQAKLTKTEYVCLGVMIEATIGWNRQRAEISHKKFMRVAGVGYDEVSSALRNLEAKQYSVVTRHEDGRREYAARLEVNPEDIATATCTNCGVTGPVDMAKGFTSLPHEALLILPSRLKYLVLSVVHQVLRETCRWDKTEKCFRVEPRPISHSELEWRLAAGSSSVAEAVATAERLVLIRMEGGRGKIKTAAAIIDRMGKFAKLPKLAAKVVNVSFNRAKHTHRSEETTNSTAKKSVPQKGQLTETKTEEVPAETVLSGHYGRCRNCGFWGPVKLVAKSAAAETQRKLPPLEQTAPARASPGPPQVPKYSLNKEIPQDLKEIFACLLRWVPRMFQVEVSLDLARAVQGGMNGCPIWWLEKRYVKRQSYIEKADSPGILAKIAAEDAGPSWQQYQSGLQGSSQVGSAHPEGSGSAGAPISAEELRNYLAANAAAVRAANPAVAAELTKFAAGAEEHVGEMQKLEECLTNLEEELFAGLLSTQSEEQRSAVRKALDEKLRPYRGRMSKEQIEVLERQFLKTVLLDQSGLPRLSLFNMR